MIDCKTDLNFLLPVWTKYNVDGGSSESWRDPLSWSACTLYKHIPDIKMYGHGNKCMFLMKKIWHFPWEFYINSVFIIFPNTLYFSFLIMVTEYKRKYNRFFYHQVQTSLPGTRLKKIISDLWHDMKPELYLLNFNTVESSLPCYHLFFNLL